ncbi:hypothetical protein GOV10_04565 [Candidatus Woesearchaeota archaeon]|nr:hypothetical protein [Candidatus Woesearchaeota archaeon]
MTQELVEKAARKELRKLDIPTEKLELLDNDSQAFVVAKHLLKEILPHMDVPIVKKQGFYTLCPASRDEVEARFIGSMLQGIPIILQKHLYLKSIAYDDLATYAKKHGLKTMALNLTIEELAAQKMVKQLQAKQSQTETALLKSIEWLQNLSQKQRK